jgi:hypothetical protein
MSIAYSTPTCLSYTRATRLYRALPRKFIGVCDLRALASRATHWIVRRAEHKSCLSVCGRQRVYARCSPTLIASFVGSQTVAALCNAVSKALLHPATRWIYPRAETHQNDATYVHLRSMVARPSWRPSSGPLPVSIALLER